MASTSPTPKDIDLTNWQKKDQDVNVKVDMVTVSGVKMGVDVVDNSGNRLIHWRVGCAYKLLDGSERSTSYDTLKHSKVDPVVQIQLISKPFLFSSTAVTTCQFKSAKDFTTTDVYNLIKDEGFGRYMYDGNGSGCLFWTKAVIAKLQAKNFIVAGSVDELEKAVTITRGTKGLWVPDDKGTFF